MSLDLSIAPNSCKHCGRGDDALEFNYTYNASRMWYKIYPEDEAMVYIDGMTGKQAYPKIANAILQMLEHEDELRPLEPENGWGSYDGFLEFLQNVQDACINCPNGVWRSFR